MSKAFKLRRRVGCLSLMMIVSRIAAINIPRGAQPSAIGGSIWVTSAGRGCSCDTLDVTPVLIFNHSIKMNTKIHIEQDTDHVQQPFRPSPEVNATFELLEEEGLKESHQGTQNNMDSLGEPEQVFPKDIGVYVDVSLEREKDRELPDRVKLAKDVQDTVADELKAIFQGSVTDNGTLLFVRVLLLSDGSSLGHRWMAEKGVGEAKLTLAYCLQSSSGEIAMANQLYATEDCAEGSKDVSFREYSAALVRSMARNLAGDIAEEVFNAIMRWKLDKKGV